MHGLFNALSLLCASVVELVWHAANLDLWASGERTELKIQLVDEDNRARAEPAVEDQLLAGAAPPTVAVLLAQV